MMTEFVTSLPPEAENEKQEVLAPESELEGTILDLLLAVMSGTASSIELDVYRSRDDTISRVRVTPDLKKIIQDSMDSPVYYIDGAYGVFLDEDSHETNNMVTVHVTLNTEVKAAKALVGHIVMWPLPDAFELLQWE